jgi:hypothetical protein
VSRRFASSAGAAGLASLLFFFLALAGPAQAASAQPDPRLDEMLRRAAADEDPTPEDQRAAARALRDWQLSEQQGPPGDPRVGVLLRALVGGQRLSPDLGRLADRVRQDYLTDAGRERRLREGEYGNPYMANGSFDPGAPPREVPAEDFWLLFLTCGVIFVGGLAIWAITRKRRRPDGRVYYQ